MEQTKDKLADDWENQGMLDDTDDIMHDLSLWLYIKHLYDSIDSD